MSYCRFADEGEGSDVYVYEADDGVVVEVAKMKLVSECPAPVKPVDFLENDESFKSHTLAMREWQDGATEHEINLPHAGNGFYGLEFGAAAELLSELSGLGYRVPRKVIEELLDDAKGECGDCK